MTLRNRTLCALLVSLGACTNTEEPQSSDDVTAAEDAPVRDTEMEGADDAEIEVTPDADPIDVSDAPSTDVEVEVTLAPISVRVMTFNVGSGASPPSSENLGFGPAESDISDEWFGNGLAFATVVEQTRQYIAEAQPDIVAFQEIFWSGECPNIPDELRAGFVCDTWQLGDPTVANLILGPDWHVACHPGKPDKCIGVRSDFGRIVGCDEALCLDGLEGEAIENCGRGARVAATTIALASGEALRVVNVHGNSGFSEDDTRCRTAQVDQIFVGSPESPALIRDVPTIVLGDLNTDPGRLTGSDASAARWAGLPGEMGFSFLTEVGPDVEPTYVLLNIDHVLARGAEGTCEAGGPATEAVHFDHVPIECELSIPR